MLPGNGGGPKPAGTGIKGDWVTGVVGEGLVGEGRVGKGEGDRFGDGLQGMWSSMWHVEQPYTNGLLDMAWTILWTILWSIHHAAVKDLW